MLEEYNLGSVITVDDAGWPRASTAPLIIRRENEGERLFAHLERSNRQVDDLAAAKPLLYVAQGLRAYVSPGWFTRRPAAPTYLHVRGRARPLQPVPTEKVLLETVSALERRLPAPWQYDGRPRYLRGMAHGVVAFEIVIEAMEAAQTLSQDRRAEERAAIAAMLELSDESDARNIARTLRGLEVKET